MTNEQLALLLDPERKRPGWWVKQQKRTYTGPDYHASDDACFRDWRPVLLAADWLITEALSGTSIQDDVGVTMEMEETYRAAILAAVAWLNEHKSELLREAIARVEDGRMKDIEALVRANYQERALAEVAA